MLPIRLFAAALFAGVLGLSAQAQNGQRAPSFHDPNDDKPWPDAATVQRSRQAAQARPLFASDEPVPVTLIADLGQVQADRDVAGTRLYPATLVLGPGTPGERSLSVQVRTRGHSRLRPDTCTFAPLRLVFQADAAGTIFEGQRRLKLGVHCRDLGDYPEYVLREYPVYRMFNLLTPNSFRARLADVKYVDAKSGRSFVRGAMFIEDDDDVARRMGGRVSDSVEPSASTYDAGMMALTTVFGYMIGNTDVSVRSLHNVRVVLMPSGRRFPVPYDFDYSGVVDAVYAVPNPLLDQSTVRQRLYLGPCLPRPRLADTLTRFTDSRTELLRVYDVVPMLKAQYRAKAKAYLEAFYERIRTPAGVKRAFIDRCGSQPFM
ncbi:MAG: hypothetical protein U0Q55_09375 [Vicinamibacterales bacterium]